MSTAYNAGPAWWRQATSDSPYDRPEPRCAWCRKSSEDVAGDYRGVQPSETWICDECWNDGSQPSAPTENGPRADRDSASASCDAVLQGRPGPARPGKS